MAPKDESKAERFIVFAIADYLLALPINRVLRIINSPTQINSQLSQAGLIQLGQHIIRVVDLQQRLSGSVPLCSEPSPFLIVMQSPFGELCAIPVPDPPNLVELLPEQMQSLPRSQHQSGVLQIASHAAVLSAPETSTTIFLLDLQRILTPIAPDSSPLLQAAYPQALSAEGLPYIHNAY